MKGKLVKIEDGYELLTQGFLKGSTNHKLIDSLNVEEGNIRYKLSLKNCQDIELGYDLDKIFQREIDELMFTWNLDNPSEYRSGMYKGADILLKLMGDKKFSEDDIKKAVEISRQGSLQKTHNGYGVSTGSVFVLDNISANDIIQSLQQTEWDVEVETVPALSNNGNVYYGDIPKLDADGCLILKRI